MWCLWDKFLSESVLVKQGEVQYFIGVQLDGSQHVEPLRNCIPEDTAKDSEKLVSILFTSFFFYILSYVFEFLSGVKLM